LAIDYWKLTRDFGPGDVVQKFIPGFSEVSPFYGRVTAVHKGIGFVDVQWPFGNERVSPEELVRVNAEFAYYLPPALDFSYYPGWDVAKSKESSVRLALWRTTELPQGFHKELARIWSKGANEVKAYDELWRRYASQSVNDEALRDEIQKWYRFARNTVDVYVAEFARKAATYWVAQNRQHRATKKEVAAKKPNCPKCGNTMRKTLYKMAEGEKIRLFACPKDLFIIRQNDIMGPDGEPVSW
jgi:hypothetical protein